MADAHRSVLLVKSALLLAPTVYAAIESPLRVILGYTLSPRLLLVDWLITLAFAIDLATRLRADRGSKRSPAGVSPLWFDVLAVVPCVLALPGPLALPLDLQTTLAPLVLLRLAKLVPLWRANRQIMHSEHVAPAVLRLVSFVFWLGLVTHWIACGWLALRLPDGFSGRAPPYVESLYWGVVTLATIGYGDIVPANGTEMLYAMAVMLLGVGMYGYVIGNVAGLLANMDSARSAFQDKMDRVQAFMTYRELPGMLRQRIRGYYRYLWESRLGFAENELLSELPLPLRTEVALYLNRPIFKKVPIFQGASEDLLRAIAVSLRPAVVSPGDWVFRANDPAHEMFFISHGAVEVVTADGKLIGRLAEGDFFGEIALIGSGRRTAGVKAVDYCDLYALDKDAFDRVLATYPDFAAHVHRLVAERRRERAERTGETTPQPVEPDPTKKPLPGRAPAASERSTE